MLTEDQRAALRVELTRLKVELESGLVELAASARPVDLDEPIGRLSRMDALQQQHMAKAGRQNTQVRLQRVKSALAAFERGDYGDCRRCEEPIGYPRLSAQPEATLCRDCQGRSEGR